MAGYHKLDGQEIIVGKPLPWDAYDAEGRLLLRKGFIIDSEAQIARLVERGLFRQQSAEAPTASPSTVDIPPSVFDRIASMQQRLGNLFRDLAAGKCLNASDTFREFGSELQHALDSHADAALGAVHLQDDCPYAVAHPMHVALISECIMRRLELPDDQRLTVVCAALTANVGMGDSQERLHGQKSALTPAQQEAIRSHPIVGESILAGSGVTDRLWLDTVRHHHERLNGSGYPDGLKGDRVTTAVRTLSLADMYSAMIKPRAYRSGFQARDAMRELFMMRGAEIDDHLAQILIKEIGIFPPGAAVRLANGETAIVIKRGADAMHPIVQAIAGPLGAPYGSPRRRHTDEPAFQVKEIVRRDPVYAPNMNALWGFA